MKPRRTEYRSDCAVEVAVSVIGGLWKPVILYHLFAGGTLRFMQLQRRIPKATQRMLTLQLRELEEDGIVQRIVHAEVPPRVEYRLTEFGRTLGPVLDVLRGWGEQHRQRIAPDNVPLARCAAEIRAPGGANA